MENLQTEKKNLDDKNEIRANEANDSFLSPQSEDKILNRNCSVCNSGFVEEIHKLRADHTLVELAEVIKSKFNVELSKDALSRHFIHYTSSLQKASTKAMWQTFQRDVESVSQHQKKTLFLGKIAFDHIVERLESGSLLLGVDDFEKLIKLYYTVLRDPDGGGDDDLIAIFQKASKEMGCDLAQGVLIKTKKKSF